MLSNTQRKVIKKLVNVLEKNRIPFQITGGLAAIIYGARRPFFDIDIDVYKKDISKLRKLFKPHISTDLHHLQDQKFDLYLLTLKINGIFVDISQAENAYIMSNGKKIKMSTNISKAKILEWEGVKLLVQNKTELIAYKKALNRDIDLTDIKQIS